MWAHLLLVSAVALVSSSLVSAADYKRVCYFGSWAGYRWGNGLYDVESIDPFSCTHFYYGFVGINVDGTVRIMDEWNEVDKRALERFNNLKKKNPDAKTLIACGGWNEGSEKFSVVARNPTLRRKFIDSALALTLKYGYDGFDLDWEYPGQRGGITADIPNFIAWIKEFREVFDRYGLLITAAVASAEFSALQSYDVPNVSKYLDFINVMTYDLHGAWDGVTGHNSPLYASSSEKTDLERQLNLDASIKWWIKNGADPAKLLVGIGLYGRTFTLANQNNRELGALAWNGGTAGPYTQESGFLGYNEFIERWREGGWTRIWDDEQKVPHAVKGNQWVGYDDVDSIGYKTQYVIDNELGGTIVWSLETDDFKGLNGTVNPLLNAIRRNLENGKKNPNIPADPTKPPPSATVLPPQEPAETVRPVPTDKPATTPETPPEIPPPAPSGVCPKQGYVRDPDNCAAFYYCASVGAVPTSKITCQSGLLYDVNLGVCNWANAVSC